MLGGGFCRILCINFSWIFNSLRKGTRLNSPNIPSRRRLTNEIGCNMLLAEHRNTTIVKKENTVGRQLARKSYGRELKYKISTLKQNAQQLSAERTKYKMNPSIKRYAQHRL